MRDTRQLDVKQFEANKRFDIPDIFAFTVADQNAVDRSLMITDLSVVEDPTRTFNPCTETGNENGAWTFGKLMTDLVAAQGSLSLTSHEAGWITGC